jgi:hypothetical protein
MKGLNPHFGSTSMALVTENVDVAASMKRIMSRLRTKGRHLMCTVIHGGHELYRARSETRLFQQCLLCGYETPGWTIDRRDRRLHLVANNTPSSVRR